MSDNRFHLAASKAHCSRLFLSCAAALAVGLLAIDTRLPAQAIDTKSVYGAEQTQGVFVRDSAVVVEKLALAERMERLKEWDKAADVYQEIVTGYADRVLPSQVDASNRIYQYSGVISAVQERLVRWPAQGLDAYRARYEAEASAALESAGDDTSKLRRIISNYFITDSARAAAIRSIDVEIERGDFAAAGWTAQRFIQLYPSLGDDRPKFVYRAALAAALAGDDALADAMVSDLKRTAPDALGAVRGKDVVLADSIVSELDDIRAARSNDGASQSALAGQVPKANDVPATRPVPAVATPAEVNWPMPFGSPDRSRIPAMSGFTSRGASGGTSSDSIARLFGIRVVRTSTLNMSMAQAQVNQFQEEDKRDRQGGVMTGILPVVDHGELFFQDNAHVYAYSIDGDQPLPGWSQTYGPAGRFSIGNAFSTPRWQQCSLSVTDSAVYAIMGAPDMVAMKYTGTFGRRETRLVCLDRHTGALRWLLAGNALPPPLDNLKQVDFVGSPLVVDGTLYLQARGGNGMQFDDSYVLAIDALSGKPRWSCYIASASAGNIFMDGDLSAANAQRSSHLAYSNGRLYAMTNLGAVASIDASDGTIAWLDLYPRDKPDPNRLMGLNNWNRRAAQSRTIDKPWTYNPVIVTQGKVFALPTDGLFVHIYDAGSGIEFKRIKLGQFDDANTILGIIDNKLILGNAKQIFCVDWRGYGEHKERDDNLLWQTNVLGKAGQPTDSIRGRGFVTTDVVVIPTAWGLVRLSMRNGSTIDTYPSASAWNGEEGAGNVIVAQDRLVVAGPSRVNVYADLSLATSKYESAVNLAPDEPMQRLNLAGVYFAAGNFDGAIRCVDEALARIGDATPTATKDRAFVTILNFAQKLGRSQAANGPAAAAVDRSTIESLYDRAALVVSAPVRGVTYRFARAAFDRQTKDGAGELKLYHEILADPALRVVECPDPESQFPTSPASVIATRQIDAVVRREGSDVYAPFEQAAAKLLADARSASDAQKLCAIIDRYPNSAAALEGLIAAADVYESRSDPRSAARVLRQAYSTRPGSVERRLVLLESLARTYIAGYGRGEVAAARLALGAKLKASATLTRPLLLPDGTIIPNNVPFAEAAQMLSDFAARVAASTAPPALPDVHIPSLQPRGARDRSGTAKQQNPREHPKPFLPEEPAQVVDNVAVLLVPPADASRNDRIATYTPGVGVRVFAPGDTRPLFANNDLVAGGGAPPHGIAWTGDDLVLWNATNVWRLDGASGATKWNISVRQVLAPRVAPLAAGLRGGDEASDDDDVGESDDSAIDAANPVARAVGTSAEGDADDAIGQFGNVQVVNLGNGGQRLIVQGNQQIILQANGQVRIIARGGLARGAAPAVAPGAADEQIRELRLVADRVVLDTSGGRVLSFDAAGGALVWQGTMAADHATAQLLASDDFVVVRSADANGMTASITVFDIATGQLLTRRRFGSAPEEQSDDPLSATASVPLNAALSPDGMLIWTTADKICGKDLFEPGGIEKAAFQKPGDGNAKRGVGDTVLRAEALPPFQFSVRPDQLQIRAQRVFVVADNGATVRVYGLRDGSPQRIGDAEGGTINIASSNMGNGVFPTARPLVRIDDAHVYVTTGKEVYGFDTISGAPWQSLMSFQNPLWVRDMIIARGHLLVLTDATKVAPPPIAGAVVGPALVNPRGPMTAMQIKAFSRATTAAGRESGTFEHDFAVSDPSSIIRWQAVDGGVCYVTGDKKLHFLRGSSQAPPRDAGAPAAAAVPPSDR